MDVVIIGAGGHGRDCHQLIDDLHADASGRGLHLIGYVDDNPELTGKDVQGLHVLGGLDWLAGRNVAGVMGIGYPRPRYAAQQRASELGVREWPTLVHPRAYVASRAKLGQGVHIAPQVSIGPNVVAEDWSIIQIGSMVGHDNIIGRHALLGASVTLGGGSLIGEGALMGCGSTTAPKSVVGAWAEVGANSVVLFGRPVPPNTLAVGAPIRVVRLLTTHSKVS